MSSETKKNVTLKTSDGETFEVEIDVINQSQTIKHMIEDDCANEFIILVLDVDGKVLAKVIEYFQKHDKSTSTEHVDDEKTKEEILREWDIEFMNSMETSSLVFLKATIYLEIKSLLDLTAEKIAYDIKDKEVEEVRKIFNMKNEFTPEEEEEKLKKEIGWIF